tara:strand:- start:210 stop:404 length:195 start_codon:yes stop_codon:yes gene_type:complete
MKATIEFLLSEADEKKCFNREEKKELLIKHIIHNLDEWLKGQAVINIEFTETDEETIKFDYIHD